jgi:hypothetical protein
MPSEKTGQLTEGLIMPKQREIPITNEIKLFMHCHKCLQEKPSNKSPREWAQLEVGWTKLGLQVWCKRHECNVCHIDFQGQKHPACLDA